MKVQNNLAAAQQKVVDLAQRAAQKGYHVDMRDVMNMIQPPSQDPSLTEARQEWLCAAAESLRPEFEARGLHYPELAFQSVDFEAVGAPHMGECVYLDAEPGPAPLWDARQSSACLLRIGERYQDTPIVGGTLIHELVHSCLPMNQEHGPEFGKHARSFHLQGKLNATMASVETLPIMARAFANAGVGEYPQLTRPIWWGCPRPGGDVRAASDAKAALISLLTRGV